jgi:serine/threonine protein kinase
MKTSDCVGPYTLLSPLGESGCARAWLATRGHGDEKVVVKVAREGDAASRARLRREADITGSLDHYNIVPMQGSGESHGDMWIEMAYVAGAPASLRLENVRQLLLALVHLHAHGVVHADIKPANMLLDGDGNLRLASFGNARRAGAGPSAPSDPSEYMSPEQLRGEELDPRTDLFSAGAVLYHVLTGRPPFERAATNAEVSDAMALVLPSEREPRLGTRFDQLIVKALARERSARYASAFAMLSDFTVASRGGRPAA